MDQLKLVFRLLVRLQFMHFQYNVYLSIVVRTNIVYTYIYTHVIQNNLRTPPVQRQIKESDHVVSVQLTPGLCPPASWGVKSPEYRDRRQSSLSKYNIGKTEIFTLSHVNRCILQLSMTLMHGTKIYNVMYTLIQTIQYSDSLSHNQCQYIHNIYTCIIIITCCIIHYRYNYYNYKQS